MYSSTSSARAPQAMHNGNLMSALVNQFNVAPRASEGSVMHPSGHIQTLHNTLQEGGHGVVLPPPMPNSAGARFVGNDSGAGSSFAILHREHPQGHQPAHALAQAVHRAPRKGLAGQRHNVQYQF